MVSPQHRILVHSPIVQRMFDTSEALVAAKHLVGMQGVTEISGLTPVHYIHIAFDDHQVIYANGAEAESLFPGPEALRAIAPEAREELVTLFPDITGGLATPARPLIEGRRGRQMTARHIKNNLALVA
jgi:hypothetical protein